MGAVGDDLDLGITEAYIGAVIVLPAYIAGGLRARCATSGEREGRSPLAFLIDPERR
jgi:hypothetical protein